MPRAALSATRPKPKKHARTKKTPKVRKVMGELIPADSVEEIEELTEGLTERARLFVFEYPKDLHGIKAAVRSGYSEVNARNQSLLLLKNPAVVKAIDIALNSRLQAVNVSADRIVAEYAKIAFLNPKSFYDADGNPLDVVEIPDDAAAAIAGIEIESRFERDGSADDKTTEVRTKKLHIASKLGALNALAKMAAFAGTFGKQGDDGGSVTNNNVQFVYNVNLIQP